MWRARSGCCRPGERVAGGRLAQDVVAWPQRGGAKYSTLRDAARRAEGYPVSGAPGRRSEPGWAQLPWPPMRERGDSGLILADGASGQKDRRKAPFGESQAAARCVRHGAR